MDVLRLADALVRVSHMVQHVFADVSRDHGLTPQQTQLLCRLVRGPMGMGDLGRALHLERSSLTGLVDRIERRDLVLRLADPHDRRACRVALTEQGAQVADAAHGAVTGRLDLLLDGLDDAERERVSSAIVLILAGHTAATGVRWT
ncbi:MarR family winged helix-turn-helix transcriptional regulator [Nonomuraea sp. NPDC002799]